MSLYEHIDLLTQDNKLLMIFNQTGTLSGTLSQPLYLGDQQIDDKEYNVYEATRIHTIYSTR